MTRRMCLGAACLLLTLGVVLTVEPAWAQVSVNIPGLSGQGGQFIDELETKGKGFALGLARLLKVVGVIGLLFVVAKGLFGSLDFNKLGIVILSLIIISVAGYAVQFFFTGTLTLW